MPFHFGLLVAVVMMLAKFVQIVFVTFTLTFSLSGKEVIVASLSLIELALIASLLLMVVFSSYEGFVSRLNDDGDNEHLDWAGHVGFGVLKIRIMASVTAISGVYLLERVIRADDAPVANIGWAAGAFALFVVASVVMAFVERFSERGAPGEAANDK